MPAWHDDAELSLLRLDWEQDLDMQKELRLRREAVYWNDPTLVELDDQSRMWEVIQMGFQQVEDILDSINLGHYRDYFIAKGMFYGAKMRALSRKFLDLHMPAITDPDEKDREGATLNFQGSMHASLLPTKI
eukprot:s6324_g3.t1